MGLWAAYRRGQAGRYAKASYRLERRRLQLELDRAARDVIVRVQLELDDDAAAIPPRPDWKG